jgi:hypothetical protein
MVTVTTSTTERMVGSEGKGKEEGRERRKEGERERERRKEGERERERIRHISQGEFP